MKYLRQIIFGGAVLIFGIGAIVLVKGTQPVLQAPASAVSGSAQPTVYTMADVAEHNSASSCWTAINGSVYDVTSWIDQHPGGAAPILSLCGTDGSSAFNAQHGGQRRPESELATFKIGTLSQ